jgi:hypothetical protein
MSDNPFASYYIAVPSKYSDDIKKYCRTAGNKVTYEYSPFERQIDFWYFAFLLAVKKGLAPVAESDTTNITPASIFSGDSYRITHIQMVYLGVHQDLSELAAHKKVLDYASDLANAGIPYVLQLLNDPEDLPLWSLLEQIEANISR